MTKEEERVREQLHELICKQPRKKDCPYLPYGQGGKHYSPFVRNPICDECLKDRILSIEGICVKADDQSFWVGIMGHWEDKQEEFHKASFVKVIEKK